ncbi:hypothetical protein Htur_4988 (plasmid) [Haloterrigena turkmenica DSM 5511]|uniref:Uncharacterized protein n=1 Tax=Haloterrigena turkmenica (strain ATCC 51198 / DSM 5511 / JCM 9101 / NCIMB 13204 / VKM B-1734 / 4k) TaxID=543526 RepID=D2S2X0_HALTV|nr:hypothetical protein [Haloterrigena turkmenica]ADB63717.1 hypothetical protein Htur_4988 [Haloterrigena turkmenica DSM 5511]
MSWTDQHQTEDAEDDDQILSEEFDDWVQEGAAPGEEDAEDDGQADTTAADEAEGSTEDGEESSEGEQAKVASMSSSTVSRQRGDEPLMMDQCPRCDGREFVSKKLVYEEFHYSEGGELEGHQNNVRAEFEYTCLECQERFHELPRSARSYYTEVAVLRQDLRRAIRVQLRAWGSSMKSWMRKPYRR